MPKKPRKTILFLLFGRVGGGLAAETWGEHTGWALSDFALADDGCLFPNVESIDVYDFGNFQKILGRIVGNS